jgi:hypothetical protein
MVGFYSLQRRDRGIGGRPIVGFNWFNWAISCQLGIQKGASAVCPRRILALLASLKGPRICAQHASAPLPPPAPPRDPVPVRCVLREARAPTPPRASAPLHPRTRAMCALQLQLPLRSPRSRVLRAAAAPAAKRAPVPVWLLVTDPAACCPL